MNLKTVLYDSVWLTSRENLENIINIVNRKTSDIEAALKIAEKNKEYLALNGFDDSNKLSKRAYINQNVGVINITGSLVRYGDMFTDISGATSTETILKDLNTLLSNPQIDKIILSIDSGGGHVNGISELSEVIYQNRDKIVAHVKGMACSAAYWIASATSKIYIEDTSIVGNIGAIMGVYKKSDNIIQFVSSQSPNKAPDPQSKEGLKEYQKRVDDVAKVFIEKVSLHLGISTEDVVSRFGGGSVFVGEDAVKIGLAHSVTSLSNLMNKFLKGGNMPKPNNVSGTMANEPKATGGEDIKAQLDAQNKTIEQLQAQIVEQNRVKAINDILSVNTELFTDEEIKGFMDDKTQNEHTVALKVVEKLKAQTKAASIVTGGEPNADINAITNAILAKCGVSATIEETKGLDSKNLIQLLAMANGVNLNTASQGEVIASMNTGNFPVILSNVQNKVIAEAYDRVPVTYREWTKSVGLKDFKMRTEASLNSFDSDFDKLSEGGSLTYGYRSEDSLEWRLYSYGKKFALTYEAIVNDDLDAFADNLRDLVENIELWKNRQVYDMLLGRGNFTNYKMADGKAIFDSTHKNTGTAGAISEDTLLEGYKKMVEQTIKVGRNKTRNAGVRPKHIIFSADQTPKVTTLLNTNGANGVNDNVVKNLVSPIPEYELVGQTAWFLAGAKKTIKTGYLKREGNRPVIEMVRNSKIHGIEYELAFRFGLVAEDFRSLFKNAGA